jgi:hypothetical protein
MQFSEMNNQAGLQNAKDTVESDILIFALEDLLSYKCQRNDVEIEPENIVEPCIISKRRKAAPIICDIDRVRTSS